MIRSGICRRGLIITGPVILSIVLALSCAASAHAADIRVVVSVFEGKGVDKELVRKVSITVARCVAQLRGFTFVSPTDFMKATIGADKLGGLKFAGVEEEYSDSKMEALQKAAEPHKGLHNLDKGLKAADITMGGTVERDGEKVRVELMAFDMKGLDHDAFSETVECDELSLERELQKSVRKLLEKARQSVGRRVSRGSYPGYGPQ